MATGIESSLSKIEKLDSHNYHAWKRDMEMLLTLKDMWEDMHEARPPPGDERNVWNKLQKHTLALIHLSCSREAAAMIAEATTGKDAWTILNDTYASTNIQNVMRLEEKFGRAKKEESQSMQQWITYVKMLGSQLQDAEVEIPPVRIAHYILSGLPKEYDSLKYSLKTRPGALTIEVVTEHLLEAEQDIRERKAEKEHQEKENQPINVINQMGNATTYQIGEQLSRPRATAMPMHSDQIQCPPGCLCSVHVQASGSIGPN